MQYSEADDLAHHKEEVDRMLGMMSAVEQALNPRSLVLDVGGGAGMHSAMLAPLVRKVICTDFSDQNARFGGEFVKLLHEKFSRNGYGFPLASFEFHAGDATDLIYRDDSFDVVVSFNAMEHIPDPALALSEMIRVTRPGGLIYLTFDPIWTCDSGSHFQHRVSDPWRHLLDDDFASAILRNGGSEDEANEFRFAMNRRRLDEYQAAFDRTRTQVDYLLEYEWSGCVNQSHPDHPNFKLCIEAGYSENELLTRGMAKLIRKPEAQAEVSI